MLHVKHLAKWFGKFIFRSGKGSEHFFFRFLVVEPYIYMYMLYYSYIFLCHIVLLGVNFTFSFQLAQTTAEVHLQENEIEQLKKVLKKGHKK